MAHSYKHEQSLLQSTDELKGDAVKFGNDFIKDAKLRKVYIDRVKQEADRILRRYTDLAEDANEIERSQIWEEGAQIASEYRNEFLNITRSQNSNVARAFSKVLKEEGHHFFKLRDVYARKVIPNGVFRDLTLPQQESVYEAIIKASGRTNVSVNRWASRFGEAGKVCLFVTAAVAIYQIAESENPLAETVWQAVSIGGGAGGAWAGGEAGAVIGELAGPVGALVGGIVGAIVGGVSGALLAEKVTEFTFENLFDFTFPANRN